MATTTNYGWTTPDDTALVKDGASAIRTLGSSVDTTTKNLNPETTLGDIAYRSSTANVKTRLGLGTAGQILAVNSGATAPEWVTSSSGGMTLISTTTLSGASTVLSSIPGTYKNLQLVVRNFKPANDNVNLRLRINADTGTRYFQLTTNSANNDGSALSFGSSMIEISGANDNSVATGLIVINVYDYANAVTWKMIDFRNIGTDANTTTTATVYNAVGYYNQTAAITSLTLFANTGNLTSGTALLYGVS
jgi:hypothetical protein